MLAPHPNIGTRLCLDSFFWRAPRPGQAGTFRVKVEPAPVSGGSTLHLKPLAFTPAELEGSGHTFRLKVEPAPFLCKNDLVPEDRPGHLSGSPRFVQVIPASQQMLKSTSSRGEPARYQVPVRAGPCGRSRWSL